MLSNQYLSLRRLYLLLKMDISFHISKIPVIFSALFGIFLIISIVWVAAGEDTDYFHTIFFLSLLMVGGTLLTSKTFSHLHEPEKGYFYLTLPCSTIERFLSRLIITTLGYVVLSVVFYYLFTIISRVIILTFLQSNLPAFNPFRPGYLLLIKIYLVIQSMFLLGSSYLKKLVYIKVLLVIMGILFAIIIFSIVLTPIVFLDCFEGLSLIPKENLPNFALTNFLSFVTNILWPFVKILFWWVMAPWLWVLTVVRLSEKEVHSGI